MRVYEKDGITLLNGDCMDYLATLKDKAFELAIVDPPFGLDMSQSMYDRGQNCKRNGYKEHLNKDWDKLIPDEGYFLSLQLKTQNQIIWGANYFTNYLKPTKSWAVWNKVQRDFSFADGELAWTSFDVGLKIFDYGRGCESGFAPKSSYMDKGFSNIHPTQKPIALYRWLLQNYAKQGDKILDTHGGSFSSAIACWDLGFTFVGIEKDDEYFDKAVQRFENHVKQGRLFTPEKKYEPIQETLIF